MLYDIRQTTSYSYAVPVRVARQVLRMTPMDRPGHQHVIAHVLDLSPEAAELERGTDFFGNGLTWLTLDQPHDYLQISTRSRVDVNATPLPEVSATPSVDDVRAAAAGAFDLGPRSPVHGLFPSRAIPVDAAITEWTSASCPGDRPILEAGLELMHRIKDDFTYEPGSTIVTTTPHEAFVARRGVCQDFAQVMIAGLRGLGLPARYVSGYLRTVPPEGQARLEGADATHAWLEIWCGAEAGWIGLDPTNAIPAGDDHIILAVGRDYADVAPVDGVIVSSGDHLLSVGVDVIPVER
ncbi:transglutaminase family protein [Xanthobacter agilis]|jgi:transglutaminase-like putative cysteine protease|uniref:Transglutaminase-like putative cysteine protease n=1 Tax=Xanthobacter agilis TaxID=47492 RepID=A0ABU0LH56_XANAG|nr:transglutaminase family protein [Xanthobacter agilis]MDQ0506466.1 transglutaminase-like putative cysteine protease [Xanthobacter agilis]